MLRTHGPEQVVGSGLRVLRGLGFSVVSSRGLAGGWGRERSVRSRASEVTQFLAIDTEAEELLDQVR